MADEQRTPTEPILITGPDVPLLRTLRTAAMARSPLVILGTRYEAVDPAEPLGGSTEHRYDIRRQHLEPVSDHAEVGPVGQHALRELLDLIYRYTMSDPLGTAETMVNVLEKLPEKELEGMQAMATALTAYVSQARRFKRLGV